MSNLIKCGIIKDGIVVNLIEYEVMPTGIPDGFDDTYLAIATDIAQIGWTYINGVFSNPNPPIAINPIVIVPPTKEELLAELQLLTNKIQSL